MAPQEPPIDLVARLQVQDYEKEEVQAALRGKRIPQALGFDLLRLAVIRGIRYHFGFANELQGVLPEFTRALNARNIMSNVVPDMDPATRSHEVPYCIWHPDTASEATYRELVRRYPSMAYQVGRACAVAGYTDLYRELDILPEVHIAEEARESGSVAIFDDIMAQPRKYNVMDDYTCSINPDDPQPGCLNGDTAVISLLDIKQGFTMVTDFDDIFDMQGYQPQIFNITEDQNIDEHTTLVRNPATNPTHDLLPLLYNPLPADLPTVHKDLLILMAASLGDVDRYARLRRPTPLHGEVAACVRGIYHSTMFAVWCSKQTQTPTSLYANIGAAITARFVMNNVLSRVTSATPDHLLPYLIWYPSIAAPSTYRELARRKPQMAPQVLRACIVAGYAEVFDEVLAAAAKDGWVPDAAVVAEARHSGDRRYAAALEARLAELRRAEPAQVEDWKMRTHGELARCRTQIFRDVDAGGFGSTYQSLYNGTDCDVSPYEMLACLPEEWRLPVNADPMLELDYVGWPPGEQ